MTHWIIEDYGSGPVIFVCANCGHKTNDPYENGVNYETCSGCGMPINSSKNEYVMKVTPEDCNGWIPVIEEAYWIPNILDLSKRVVYECPHCKHGHGRIVIEKKYDFCPHCGIKVEPAPYQPTCPQGYDDCVCDPAYIKHHYPEWYKKLYGDITPEEASAQSCDKNCSDCYDDEDK